MLDTEIFKKKIDTALVLIVSFPILVFITGVLTEFKFSDEIFHFWFARDWCDLSQRPLYNKLVDTIEEIGFFRYYDNAPLWHFGLAYLGKAWGGISKNLAQLYQTLFYLLLIANTYLLTKELYGRHAARWAALIVATIPMFVSFGVLFFMDMPIAAFTPLLLFFMVKRKFALAGVVLAIMCLTKRNAYLLFPAIAVLTFLPFQPDHLKFRLKGIKYLLIVFLVALLITIPDFVFRYNNFGGFIFSQDTTFPQKVIQPEDKSSKKSIVPQKPVPPKTTRSQKSEIREVNYIPSSITAEPFNILKYLGIVLLLLLLLLLVNLKKLFSIKDIILLLPIITYLPLFPIAFKGWLAIRYVSPIIPLVVVLVSKLFTPLEDSPSSSRISKWLRRAVLFLCLLQFASTLVFVYMNRQVSPGEREAINYIKNNTQPDSRILTPDELFFSYYTGRATFWKSSPRFVSDFSTLFWGSRKKTIPLLRKYGIDYIVIKKERIYDDTKIRYEMGGGFPRSFVKELSSGDSIKVYQNDEITIWSIKAEDWFNEGIKALGNEDYKKSIKCLEKTIAINPNFSLSTVYDEKVTSDKDTAEYRKSRSKSPIDLPSFEESAERLLRKTEILREKAQSFDQKKALMKLGMNSMNGFYYRFDEHIKEAICEDKSLGKDKTQKDSTSFGFEFNSSDTLKFKPKKGKFTLEKGILKFRYIKYDYLESMGDLNIVKENIGEIELRIKLKKVRRIQLGWSSDRSAEWGKGRIGVIKIETVPDSTFHTYKINAKNVLRRRLGYKSIIRKVFLLPLNVYNDEIEIDYIRFTSKREKYGEEPYGETYETIAKEMRKVVYTNTPLCLKYSLAIPEGKAFLRFGMGILEGNDPITFRVVIKGENTKKIVFSKKIITTDIWQDAKIDLSQWSGENIEISFKTDSAKGNIAFWSNPLIYTSPKEKFNVIIVLEDALRADHMSCYEYSRDTTPAKDKFIEEGVLFKHAFSQATKTRPSCPSIMTSLYPSATGVWQFSEMLDDNYLTLAEIMRNQGFATASFIQNGNAGPFAGLHQGFSNLFDSGTMGSLAKEIYGDDLYGWIETHSDSNIFLYLHLVDPHGAYDPPKPFDSWYREASPGKILVKRDTAHDPEWVETPTLEGRRLLYDGEVRYNDFYFEKFLDKLEEYKLLDNTLMVFTSDHGEHLGEHGLWEHHPPGYIQGIQVPLLMFYPKKLPRNVEITKPVQLIDIMPTILDLANIEKGNLLIEGDSLVSLMHGKNLNFWNNRLSISEEVVYKNKDNKSEWASVFYKNWHIINSNKLRDDVSKLSNRKTFETFFTTRVFNYSKDKEEEHYLNSSLSDMFFNYKVKRFVREFQENNMSIWKTLTKDGEKTIKYDPEVLERLRGLGYLQ